MASSLLRWFWAALNDVVEWMSLAFREVAHLKITPWLALLAGYWLLAAGEPAAGLIACMAALGVALAQCFDDRRA